ncbi:MAG TPA: hypothetical protein VN326_08060 [Casimicrobiaceae bacterium]|nr:hypothetical protein [Casimicrobiaceae bacterium]
MRKAFHSRALKSMMRVSDPGRLLYQPEPPAKNALREDRKEE